MIRAILFDLDDTLILEANAVREALALACAPFEETHGLPSGSLAQTVTAVAETTFASLDVTAIETRFGVIWEECLWVRFGPASQKQIPQLPPLAELLRRTVWTDALKACDIRSPIAAELEARFVMERRKGLRPFEGARELIESLRDRALLIGCATNGASEVQREKLAGSGTLDWFDAVTVSGEEGIGKPDPRILLRLCEDLGVQPSEAIYVGNSLRRDVAAAKNAGMLSVWIDRFEPEPDLRIPGSAPGARTNSQPLPTPDRVVYEAHGILGLIDGWRAGRAFRVFDQGRVPLAVDEPVREGDRFVCRVGAEADELRPAVWGETPTDALAAAIRSLRARAEGRSFRHELGEPIDWDALLR